MKVLIADKFEKAGLEQLQAMGCNVTLDADLSGESLRDAVRENGAQVLIVRSTKVPPDVIEAGKSLELIIRAGAGYDTIDTAAAKQHGIRVCNCPGKNSVAVAELTLGMMLSLDRRIVDNTLDLRNGVWAKKEYSKARGLKGRTLGIVGLGRIGYEIAKRAAAFDMNLIYSDVIDQKEIEKELGIRKVPFEHLLAEADFVSLHVPGGAGTRHMISTDQFKMMKPTAFVLNCSRGGVVDEKALVEAVENGRIAGAGLDVYEIEPLATGTVFEDSVIKAARVYGTHHIGASTEQAQLAVADEVVRIIAEKMKGNDPPNCVNM
ncbi:MAG TPA: hydroxyacid dehydrogenase [Phycisphaerae bacterium]|nr:hydroxyacid dehydrogenase [Phycisphaerae bacterium]